MTTKKMAPTTVLWALLGMMAGVAQAKEPMVDQIPATNLRHLQSTSSGPSLANNLQNLGAGLKNALVPHWMQDALGIAYQPQAGYQLTLAYNNVADTSPFTSAASTWQNVITTDIADFSAACSPGTSNCGCIPCNVDDTWICAEYMTLDSGVLGAAGPTYLRTSGSLPVSGIMFFDDAQIDSSQLNTVILHEMGHVIGIGTLWTTLGLANSDSPTCTYSSTAQASVEYQTLSGCASGTAIPLENDGGSGTACGHWDDLCFGTELMTGFISSTNPFSRITIGGLQDLGYTVDFNQADASYTSASLDSSCICTVRKLESAWRNIDQEENASNAERPTHRRVRAPLSDEGRATAVAFGQAQLAANKQKHDSEMSSFRFGYSADSIYYVGDKIINVLFKEGEELYDVLVLAEGL